MRQLVHQRRVKGLACGHGLAAGEAGAFGHQDVVGRRTIAGLRAGLGDAGARRGKETIGLFDRREEGSNGKRLLGSDVALHLVGVEHVAGARDQALGSLGLSSVLAVGLDGECLVEDDERRLLATPDLTALLLPLAIRSPDGLGIALMQGGDPEGEDIDAIIMFAGGDVSRAAGCAAPVPGEAEFACAILDGGDDAAGDFLMDVEPGFAGHGAFLFGWWPRPPRPDRSPKRQGAAQRRTRRAETKWKTATPLRRGDPPARHRPMIQVERRGETRRSGERCANLLGRPWPGAFSARFRLGLRRKRQAVPHIG